MSGNTSSSPSGRSLGYISPASSDGVNAIPTVVNVYVDSNSGASYSPTTSAQPNQVNFETSSGITSAFKKSYQYVPTVPTASGKYSFDALTPPTSSTSNLYQKLGSPVKLSNTDASTAASNAVKYASAVNPVDKFFKKANATSDNKSGITIPIPPANPKEYQWNLPPHKWSMPRTAYSDPASMPKGSYKSPSNDSYRRGRIWWKASSSLSTVDGNGKTVKIDNADRKYGFQFLWNPTSFGTSVAVQMDATPNVNDQWLGGVGFFPSTENISFTLEINRINDFAAANALFGRPTNIGKSFTGLSSNQFITPNDVTGLLGYYNTNGGFSSSIVRTGSSPTATDKLVDLFQRGTLADIEYLYKAINGPGPGGSSSGGDQWKNSRGIITSDIGFLMPTLLNIDIGPLSYTGYVTSMSVNHTMFTQDMIPTQSTVQLSFNLLATAGVATTTTGG
jgi:hypothetical protein